MSIAGSTSPASTCAMNARRVVDARPTVSAIAVRRRERSDRDDRGLGIVSEVDCEVTSTTATDE